MVARSSRRDARFMSVRQVAEAFGLSRSAVYTWPETPGAPVAYEPPGSPRLYRVADVEAWIEAHQHHPGRRAA